MYALDIFLGLGADKGRTSESQQLNRECHHEVRRRRVITPGKPSRLALRQVGLYQRAVSPQLRVEHLLFKGCEYRFDEGSDEGGALLRNDGEYQFVDEYGHERALGIMSICSVNTMRDRRDKVGKVNVQ
jgi:hypothetical protein